ncbi:hypothetical protein TrRE_jg8234 [Triparma retinervis]|uniref:RGS domain-containing protein n=1 Tax=Triparma retinervis TaxID=2557542 RepID=A0A9W6Z7E7_9STRA|nr:hypothetical protein TrRE_jg8234 [Triparma retinervis]
MGGGHSSSKATTEVPVHYPKTSWSGKVVKGGFSAGPRTMEKIRTRSDFCLLKIVEEDIVQKAFSQWARSENVKEGGVYLEFVLDVNEMKNESISARQRAKSLEIFKKYLPVKAEKKLMLDKPTRRTIELAFVTDKHDYAVFDLAYEKAYQCLKFDYMPQFLISDAFMALESGTKVRRGSSANVIELKAILVEPRAMKALSDFLNEQGNAKMLTNVRLWEHIADFKADYEKMSPQDQQKRSKKIWVDCQAATNDEYKLDSVVMTLSDFKDDRQLKRTKEDYVADLNTATRLENVLEDPLLSAYFRRFLRVSFQEENYLFFRDVQDMKIQHFVKSATPDIELSMSLDDILSLSANKIFSAYVKEGSMYQVNLSAEVRDKLKESFGNNDIHSGVFDKAQREIFHQMRNGGFMEFKKHDLFEHFKQAHKRKFAQRNFVVGFQPKKEEIKEHYKLKESSLNFDEITDEDKYFDFDAHLKNKKLDAITKENIKDFEKDMQGVL